MTLFACLLIMGVSSYSYFLRKNEQQIIIDELRNAIRYAKLQAMINGNSVFLIPSDVSLNWAKGMTLNFMNRQTNQVELIYQWQWSHPHWSLHWTGVSSNNKIIFSNNPTQAMSNGHFSLININTHEKITLTLNRLGRIRLSNNLSLKQ